MNSLTLTLVIPVYNEQDHLKTCLDAIAAQTVMPEEVIVVDNNSTDRSVDIAAAFSFVRVMKAEKQGIAYARDVGFDAARSTLIGRIDADTVLSENWVEEVLAAYGENQDFALTGGCHFYNVPMPKINGWVTSQLVYRLNRFIMGHYVLWGSNMVLPKMLWQNVKAQVCTEQSDIHEDLDLAIHLHRAGFEVTYHEDLRVGVEMKRVYDESGTVHKARMMMWPNTLYAHGLKRAWLGRLGAYLLYQGRLFIRFSNLISTMYKTASQHLTAAWSKPD